MPMRRFQSNKFSIEVLLLILLPILLCLINSNWIFNPIFGHGNNADPWLYNGLFRSYGTVGRWIEDTGYSYYMERVAWGLPGYILYHIFPPIIANYILHGLVYYLAIFSFFALLNYHLGKSVAFFTSLLLGTYPWFLVAVGSDYLDGYAIALFLFLLYLTRLALDQKKWWHFSVIGAVCIFIISLNPSLALLVLNGLLYTIWLNYQKGGSLKELVKRLPFILVGIAVGALFLSGVYYLFTGSFNNWDTTLHFSRTFSKLFRTKLFQEQPPGDGTNFPGFHLVSVAIALATPLYLLRSRQIPKQQVDFFLFIVVLFTLNSIYWIIMDATFIHYLSIYLYSSYLMPFTFMLLGCLIFVGWHLLDATIARVELYWLALLIPMITSVIYNDAITIQDNPPLMIISTGLLIGSLLFLPASRWTTLVLVIAFASTNFLGAKTNSVYMERGIGVQNYNTIGALADSIFRRYPDMSSLSEAWVWKAAKSPFLEDFSVALATGHHWTHSINPYAEYPEMSIPVGTELIIIANDSDDFSDLQEMYYSKTDNRLELLATDSSVANFIIYYTKSYSALGERLNHKYDLPLLPSDQWRWEYGQDPANKLFWTGPANKRTYPVSFDNANRNLHFEMCVVSAFTPNFPQSVQVYLDEHPLQLSVLSTAECLYLFSGTIDATWITPNIEQSLHIIAETVLVGDATYSRELGILIDWFRFGTVSPLAIGYKLGKVYDPPILPNQERVMELTLEGATVLWTGPTAETIFPTQFPSNARDLSFEMCVVSAFTPNFPHSVQVYLDEHPLQLSILSTEECPYLFSGTIDAIWITLEADQLLRIIAEAVLVGDATYSRELGILIDWFRFGTMSSLAIGHELGKVYDPVSIE